LRKESRLFPRNNNCWLKRSLSGAGAGIPFYPLARRQHGPAARGRAVQAAALGLIFTAASQPSPAAALPLPTRSVTGGLSGVFF